MPTLQRFLHTRPSGPRPGARAIDGVDERLAHELADCLWSVIVLANRYGVDLEHAFAGTMGELEVRLT